MSSRQASLLLLVAVCIIIIYVGAVLLWRLLLCPLARFPGPKWAAVSLWAEFYYDVICRGTFIWRIEDMHRQYGPCVRINPYEIHIIDPDFYDELYVHPKKLDKYKWWTKLAGADGSSFSTVPHELHRLRRGALNPFFSLRSVSQLEPLIRSKVEKLCCRLNTVAQTGEVVRLDAAFMALTMDVICDYSFANDPRYLDEADFKLEWKQTIVTAFEGGALGRQFPWLLPLMKRLPLALVEAMNPPLAFLLRWQAGVEERVKPILERRDGISLSGDKEASSRTIFHALRDSDLPEREKSLQRLCDEGQILTGAGSETTAQTLTRLFFYLRQRPDVLVKLREELQQVLPVPCSIPSWAELQQLPHLTAVIKEALRLSYGVTTRMPRIARQDIKYKEYTIPSGTPISQTPYFILMHPSVFPEPNEFKPERWVESGGKESRLDRYLVSFGKGSRQCLGINLAHAEIYLTTAMLVRQFDWHLYETTLDDIVCQRDFFVAVASLESKGVRATFSTRNGALPLH